MTRNAIITGASSGIGQGLARELARRGWSVALMARRADLMEAECAALTSAGLKAIAIPCDITDREAVLAGVRRAESALGGPFDLAIANAGVGTQMTSWKFDLAVAEEIMKVNVLGAMYLFAATVPSMVERRSGHFVGVASLAGHRGLPSAAVYSASKAALQTFLEASRIELAPFGVAVTTVNPGFIATAMTEKNRFRMPFLMKTEEAVPLIIRGIEARKGVVEFPRPMAMATRVMRFVPDGLYARLFGSVARAKAKGGRT